MNGFYQDKTKLPLVLEPERAAERSLESMTEWIADRKQDLFTWLYRDGALLFRGFDLATESDFASIARTILPELLAYSGGDAVRQRVDRGIYTSTNMPSMYDIPLHNEKSYSNDHPRILLFFCATPPLDGGETLLLDGRLLLDQLPHDIVEIFASKQVKYIQNLHDGFGLGKSWQETFETEDRLAVEGYLRDVGASFAWHNDSSLCVTETVHPIVRHPFTGEAAFFSQADQWHPSGLAPDIREAILAEIDSSGLYHDCRFGDDSAIPPEMLTQIRNVMRKNAVAVRWKHGDILVLDNYITLHGRAPFTGERRILLAMG